MALAGILTAGAGVVTAHGLLYLVDVPLIQIAMIVPFLVLCKWFEEGFKKDR